MYVTEGMKSFKVYWKDFNGNESYLFVEALKEETAIKEAEDYIPKIYKGSFSIIRAEERR